MEKNKSESDESYYDAPNEEFYDASSQFFTDFTPFKPCDETLYFDPLTSEKPEPQLTHLNEVSGEAEYCSAQYYKTAKDYMHFHKEKTVILEEMIKDQNDSKDSNFGDFFFMMT